MRTNVNIFNLILGMAVFLSYADNVFADDAGYTPEQEAAYQEVWTSYQAPLQEIAQKMWASHLNLQETIRAESFDEAKVRALGEEMGNLMVEMQKLNLDMMIDLRNKGVGIDDLYMMMGPGMMMGQGMMMGPGSWMGPSMMRGPGSWMGPGMMHQ